MTWMRTVGRVWFQIVIVCVFVWITLAVRSMLSAVFFHADEISWFFHTKAFEQAVLKKDISSSFWTSYESFDQPPLVKYIFGLYLWEKDKDIFVKRDRLETEWGRWAFYENPQLKDGGFQPFIPYILSMREVNVPAILGVLLGFFLLLRLCGVQRILATGVLLVLATNPMFLQEMIHATSDAYMLCFVLFSVLFYGYSIQHRYTKWLGISLVSAAFALSSKLTGLIGIISIVIFEFVALCTGRCRRKKTVLRVLFVSCVTFVLWIILNPALYRHPLKNTMQYGFFRNTQSYRLQLAQPSVAFIDVSSKVRASWCTVIQTGCGGFFEKGGFSRSTVGNLVPFFLGLFYIIGKLRSQKERTVFQLIGTYLYISITWTVMYLPLHYGRYYLPIQIGVFIISAFGLQYMLETVGHRMKKTPHQIGEGFF